MVVATGGLGPTADDLTRDVLAQVAGRELVLDEASLEYIRGLFARYKRDMPERNRSQAMFPAGSRDHSQRQRHGAGHLARGAAAQPAARATCLPCRACRPKCSRCSTQTVAPAVAELERAAARSFAIAASSVSAPARATSNRCCPT